MQRSYEGVIRQKGISNSPKQNRGTAKNVPRTFRGNGKTRNHMSTCITFRYSKTTAAEPITPARYTLTSDCLRMPMEKAKEIADRILDGTDAWEGSLSLSPEVAKQVPVHIHSGFRAFAKELKRLLPEMFYYCELESNTLLFLMLASVPAGNTRPEILGNPRSDILVDVRTEDFDQYLTEVAEASRDFYETEAQWEARFNQIKRYLRARNYVYPESPLDTPELAAAKKAWCGIAKMLGLTSSELATERWEILDGLPHVIVRKRNGELMTSYFEDQTGDLDMYWDEGFASDEAKEEWQMQSQQDLESEH